MLIPDRRYVIIIIHIDFIVCNNISYNPSLIVAKEVSLENYHSIFCKSHDSYLQPLLLVNSNIKITKTHKIMTFIL